MMSGNHLWFADQVEQIFATADRMQDLFERTGRKKDLKAIVATWNAIQEDIIIAVKFLLTARGAVFPLIEGFPFDAVGSSDSSMQAGIAAMEALRYRGKRSWLAAALDQDGNIDRDRIQAILSDTRTILVRGGETGGAGIDNQALIAVTPMCDDTSIKDTARYLYFETAAPEGAPGWFLGGIGIACALSRRAANAADKTNQIAARYADMTAMGRGALLRASRKAHGSSQKEAASHFECDVRTIRRWETQGVNTDTFIRVNDAYKFRWLTPEEAARFPWLKSYQAPRSRRNSASALGPTDLSTLT
jgi:hypothetical protein